MENHQKSFIGLDLGTGGLRALLVSEGGDVLCEANAEYTFENPGSSSGHHEQDPRLWWTILDTAMTQLADKISSLEINTEDIVSLSMDGTSGTLLCLDAQGEAVGNAIMYNDSRAESQCQELNAQADDHNRKLGYPLATSFALPKALWVLQHKKEEIASVAQFAHPADYILGKLCGKTGISDYSHALKLGYDLIDERWPVWLNAFPEILERLPEVVVPGDVMGHLQPELAKKWNLSPDLKIVHGVTDGTAGFLASGACEQGEMNTVIGTTTVFKCVSLEHCSHPEGLVYSHKLPGDLWLPGAASNLGGEWMRHEYAGEDLDELGEDAAVHLPSRHLAYPLMRKGERFPFVDAEATASSPSGLSRGSADFAAKMQAVALMERLSIEVMQEATGFEIHTIYATGGGSKSKVWNQLRADLSRRLFKKPRVTECAFGSALIAASRTHFDSLQEATRAMVQIEAEFEPNPSFGIEYDEIYENFKKFIQDNYPRNAS